MPRQGCAVLISVLEIILMASTTYLFVISVQNTELDLIDLCLFVKIMIIRQPKLLLISEKLRFLAENYM